MARKALSVYLQQPGGSSCTAREAEDAGCLCILRKHQQDQGCCELCSGRLVHRVQDSQQTVQQTLTSAGASAGTTVCSGLSTERTQASVEPMCCL